MNTTISKPGDATIQNAISIPVEVGSPFLHDTVKSYVWHYHDRLVRSLKSHSIRWKWMDEPVIEWLPEERFRMTRIDHGIVTRKENGKKSLVLFEIKSGRSAHVSMIEQVIREDRDRRRSILNIPQHVFDYSVLVVIARKNVCNLLRMNLPGKGRILYIQLEWLLEDMADLARQAGVHDVVT